MINLSPKESARYHDMFRKLDVNSDGRIDVNDLVTLFDKLKNADNTTATTTSTDAQIANSSSNSSSSSETNVSRAQKLISKGDKTSRGDLTFNEFVQYMIEHEKILELVFKGIDTDNNDQISCDKLVEYFRKLNIDISTNEARKLVSKISKNGSLNIQPDEWKNYFFLAPIDSVDDLIYHWRYSTIFDSGDEIMVADELPDEKDVGIGSLSINLIAGAIAGASSRTSTAPFDRLKTVMQALGSRKQITIVGGFRHMLMEGGFISLWRGNGMNVVKITPELALKFMFYEEFKAFLIGNEKREPTVSERFISGSLAGGMAQSIIYPLELLKTRMVLRKTGEYSSIFDCANKIIKYEGLRAFYKGYMPNILGIIPYAGTDLAVYETLKKFYMKRHQVENPSIPVLLLCGSISSISGQLVSYPLALARTRLQAQEVPMDSSERDSMSKLFVRIWRNEGVRGLYRGLLPNIIKVVPAVSISYVVYENMKKRLIIPPVNNRKSENGRS